MRIRLKSIIERFVTIVVILGLVLPTAPFFISTARADGSTADQAKLAASEYLNGATEQVSKRTAHGRAFETTGGQGWVELHSESINYQVSNCWFPIDNTLTTTPAATQACQQGGNNFNGNGFSPMQQQPPDPYQYVNTANRFTAKFKSTLASHYFKLTQGSNYIDFGLVNGTASTATVSDNSISYPNVLSGVSLKYSVQSDSVKSDIILSSEPSSRTITYVATLSSSSLSLSLVNGNVAITSGSNVIWTLPKPSIIQPITHDQIFTSYSLSQVNSTTYNVSFTIPDSFLPAPEESYPVDIDPSIVITDSSNTASNFVLAGDPTTVYQNSTSNSILPVGQTSYDESQGFLKLDTSGIPTGKVIDGATFGITMQEERASIPRIKLYNVTQDWNPTTLNWNNKPSVASTFEDSSAGDISYAWWNFDVTNLVKGWYAGTTSNYGFSLQAHDSTISRRNFLSKYYSTDPNRQFNPYIIAYYHTSGGSGPSAPTMLGQKSWWKYTSLPLAIGTAEANVANGNLVFNFNDVSVQDLGLDVGVSHTYNSQDTYNDKFGYGWTLSANKRLVPSQDRKTVLYIDETGTTFTFNDSGGDGNYVDNVLDASSGFYSRPDHRPNGLNWGLKYNSSSTHYIAKSNDNLTYTFDSSGKILSEVDKNGNTITYS
ncbi:MAG TPA: DNRLRE domain-containing protein, partial [Candidatus Saccharimonadales bacterium]|nr:DNRLRE domain-containing protein [Candidatus Saccharimonadales bacterium]